MYIARYCERTGRSGIDNWNFYLVFSLFRLAAIIQGIVKRAQIGTASSAEAHSSADGVKQLAALGMLLTEVNSPGAEAPDNWQAFTHRTLKRTTQWLIKYWQTYSRRHHGRHAEPPRGEERRQQGPGRRRRRSDGRVGQ
ncbi:MAG: hypothetical protein R3E54_09275 [Halioglobus sp.]